ncbi:protein shisa-5 isoform X1 [Dipodomys merriami]|uniref:protein shisa-5 isoform X1 n=1 Tax=Dipodomys merriami TaxID=94247 RepID=UPI00384FE7AE
MAGPTPVPGIWWLWLLLLSLGAHGEMCLKFGGDNQIVESCPDFCCGSCAHQYCCSDVLKKFEGNEELCGMTKASASNSTEPMEQVGVAMRFGSSYDSDDNTMPEFGATIAIGLTILVLFVVTIIVCFTCSCCCLYKMCRRPRPIVTTTTATTVVHAPYPQPPNVPPSYPGPTYQGYQPMPPQPTAPYPAQYPPPYPAQPMGPPAYHETLAGGAAVPYPTSQPPYNPAYMNPPKAAP